MKSFSLDTPDPPKHLLGIDETTKKKSSSFTNTCFGVATDSTSDRYSVSAINLRKKFAASNKASSLEYEDKKAGSHSPSPKNSPKFMKKQNASSNVPYVVLYNFRGKEKDDLDLRAGWRVNITDSSDQDWWKGKYGSKSGYFPAAYVIPLQPGQRVFQVTQAMHLTEGENGMKLHKDQIVLQAGEEENGMIHVMAANNKRALCPLMYLNECM